VWDDYGDGKKGFACQGQDAAGAQQDRPIHHLATHHRNSIRGGIHNIFGPGNFIFGRSQSCCSAGDLIWNLTGAKRPLSSGVEAELGERAKRSGRFPGMNINVAAVVMDSVMAAGDFPTRDGR
jgi:hypothetical protein